MLFYLYSVGTMETGGTGTMETMGTGGTAWTFSTETGGTEPTDWSSMPGYSTTFEPGGSDTGDTGDRG